MSGERRLVQPGSHWSAIGGPAIATYWGDVWPLVELAVKRTHGRHSERSVYERIWDGDFQCWLAGNEAMPIQLAVITEIVNYPCQRWCRIVFGGGSEASAYLGFLEAIETWAKANGCEGVEIIGRPGWSRRLPASYKETNRHYQRAF